jgi:Ca-activated chloride channel family protein
MLARIGTATRLDIAKEVIGKIVASLPADSEAGLRVYGHRFTAIQREQAATDSELLIPVGTLEPAEFLATVRGLRARGGTPLAYSLREAIGDVSEVERARIICVTDGAESFGGDPPAEAAALVRSAPEAELVVVGFGIADPREKASLRAIAEASGGRYFDASDTGTLVTAIDSAIHPRIPFTLTDAMGKEIERGVFGDRKTVLEGSYLLLVSGCSPEEAMAVRIAPSREVRVEPPPCARASEASAPGPPVETAPTQTEPAARKFCTQCGARLKAGAKFCTSCGTRVAP